jgi:type I restriction enzyme M protein
MASLKPDSGRSVVLWPHGVLFRDAEGDIRRKMIEGDYVDAVIGLGKNLFYNSSMESCLLVCRMHKPEERKGKIIFINAVNEVHLERSSAWLEKDHIKNIACAFLQHKDIDGFAKIANINQVLENNGNLSIPLYVKVTNETQQDPMKDMLKEIKQTHDAINASMENLFDQFEKLGIEK